MATKQKQEVKAKTKAKVSSGVAEKTPAQLVREQIQDAESGQSESSIDLSRLLYDAYHKEYYREWGFDTFEAYAEAELQVGYRKGQYLIGIWDKVKSLNLSVERVKKVGWTKMKDIAAVVTKDNQKELLEKSEKMTSREVTEMVKVMRVADPTQTAAIPKITTISIRMGESEAQTILSAIEEAKKLCGSDNQVLALEMVCQDWLTDKGAVPERSSLENLISYAEKVYGVYLVPGTKEKKKAVSETAKKANEVVAQVEKDAVTKKSEPKPEPETSDAPADSDVDLNSLLGI